MTDISQVMPPTAAQAGAANNAAGAAQSSQIQTPTDFAHALLQYMGLPDTDANVQALVAWAAAEGGNWRNTASYNPFNTTLGMPGSSVMPGGNSAGVQAYTSWQEGIEATAKTLEGGAYKQIIAALQAGNNAGAVASAVTSSPWGTQVIDLGSAGQYGGTTGGPGGGGIVTAAGSSPTGQVPPYDPNTQYAETTAQEQQWLQTYAPQYAWMLNEPGVANAVAYAKQFGLTDITGLLEQTDWWKQHSAAQRQWAQVYANDPQSAAKLIHDAQINIQQQAGQMGITLTPDQLNTLAIDYNYFGLTPQELQVAIGQYSSTKAPSATLSSLKQDAAAYMIPMSDQTAQQYLTQINSGMATQQQIDAQMQQQAMTLYGKYSDLGAAISRGIKPSDYLQPYAEAASTLLDVSPDQINFNNPKWAQALFGSVPGATTGTGTGTGGSTANSTLPDIYSFQNTLRSNPLYGYQYSQDAHQQAANLEQTLLQTFGKM